MANKIQVKRGVEANIPILDVGEPAFTTDTKKPFIGTDTGNMELATKEQIMELATKEQINSLDAEKADIIDLNQTNNDVNAINLRVDNLVIPISPENTNIEVTDAHNSIIKNKNFASLKDRFEENESDLAEHKLDYANKVISIDEEIYDIQRYLGKFEVKSWAEVQEIVRQGNASKYFKVGDQFIANYNSSPFTWDIIGIDHDKPTDTSKEHSLTLQAHDCINELSI